MKDNISYTLLSCYAQKISLFFLLTKRMQTFSLNYYIHTRIYKIVNALMTIMNIKDKVHYIHYPFVKKINIWKLKKRQIPKKKKKLGVKLFRSIKGKRIKVVIQNLFLYVNVCCSLIS